MGPTKRCYKTDTNVMTFKERWKGLSTLGWKVTTTNHLQSIGGYCYLAPGIEKLAEGEIGKTAFLSEDDVEAYTSVDPEYKAFHPIAVVEEELVQGVGTSSAGEKLVVFDNTAKSRKSSNNRRKVWDQDWYKQVKSYPKELSTQPFSQSANQPAKPKNRRLRGLGRVSVRALENDNLPKCLAICMVWPNKTELDYINTNQATRDFTRLYQLQVSGYNVYSVDRWHQENRCPENRHLSADFRVPHRFLKSLKDKWEGMTFDICIWDYFWMPDCVGWWGNKLFTHIIPYLAREHGVKELWFPNDKGNNMWNLIHKADVELFTAGLNFELVAKRESVNNPLYKATDACDRKLKTLPGPMYNGSQVPLYLNAENPFIRFFTS